MHLDVFALCQCCEHCGLAAMYIPFRGGSVVFSNWLESAVGLFSMSVGDFEDMYAYFDGLPTPFMEMTKVRESQRVQKASAKPLLA